MKPLVDRQLATEAARFRLRFACDDCIHFAPERAQTCGQGWPTTLRGNALEAANAGARGEPNSVSFCKEFELA